MKSTRYAAAACVALSVTLPAAAQVTVGDPWIRGTVPQQMSTGAFMQLRSATDAKLIEARSPVAGVVLIDVNGTPKKVPFIIGGGKSGSPFTPEQPKPSVSPVRRRT